MRKFNHNVPRDVINELANNKYDIIIDPSLFDIPVHRLRLFRQIKAKSVLGFNKWPSIKHYSHSFDFDCQRWHVTKTFELIADYLQLDTRGLDAYDLAVPGPIMQEVAQYLASLSGKAVVINIFAGHADRSLSQTQLAELLDKLLARHPGSAVILLDHRREIRIPLPPEVVINPFNTLHHAMALIAQAELIISPDTSVVHMAAAWNKPLIAVYKDVLLNNRLWAPGYDNARQIIVKCGKVHQHRGLVDRIIAARAGSLFSEPHIRLFKHLLHRAADQLFFMLAGVGVDRRQRHHRLHPHFRLRENALHAFGQLVKNGLSGARQPGKIALVINQFHKHLLSSVC